MMIGNFIQKSRRVNESTNSLFCFIMCVIVVLFFYPEKLINSLGGVCILYFNIELVKNSIQGIWCVMFPYNKGECINCL